MIVKSLDKNTSTKNPTTNGGILFRLEWLLSFFPVEGVFGGAVVAAVFASGEATFGIGGVGVVENLHYRSHSREGKRGGDSSLRGHVGGQLAEAALCAKFRNFDVVAKNAEHGLGGSVGGLEVDDDHAVARVGGSQFLAFPNVLGKCASAVRLRESVAGSQVAIGIVGEIEVCDACSGVRVNIGFVHVGDAAQAVNGAVVGREVAGECAFHLDFAIGVYKLSKIPFRSQIGYAECKAFPANPQANAGMT